MLGVMRARPAVVPVVLAAVLFAASPVLAESAADKATARELATEGIELYKKEKYSEALDRMKRAEQLFDAPVHLLYIARSQEKLAQDFKAMNKSPELLRGKIKELPKTTSGLPKASGN